MVTYSILLPTHNRADVLTYSIQSILNQTFSDFELLIVGDGCTDGTEEMVKSFMSADKRIKWFPFKKGKGFGYEHRNNVLKVVKGKYIAYAAHDDLWFPDHLEIISSFLKKNPDFAIGYTQPLWMHPNGALFPSFFDTDNQYVKFSFMHVCNGIPATCVVHTKEALIKAGYWNAALPNSADWDLWKRIVNHDRERRIGYISTPTTIHFRANWRNDNSSQDEVVKNIYSKVIGIDSDLKFVPENNKKILQEIMFANINTSTWIEKLREKIKEMIDPKLINILALLEQNNALLKRNKTLQEHIGLITKTKGYKLIEFFRKIIEIARTQRKSESIPTPRKESDISNVH